MLVGGWACLSEKYEFVDWDDEIPNIMEKYKMFQTTDQYAYIHIYILYIYIIYIIANGNAD